VKDITGADLSWIITGTATEREALRCQNVLNELIGVEATFGAEDDILAPTYGWRPYPLGQFGAHFYEAFKVADPSMGGFLEAGSGIGTKLALVSELFRYPADGFDINRRYVQTAQEFLDSRQKYRGDVYVSTWVQDVEDFNSWSASSIVFLNRPLRDLEREVALEKRVYDRMAPGAVLILGNPVTFPPHWRHISQGIVCSVWQKIDVCPTCGREK
jgi:hypothetical protein